MESHSSRSHRFVATAGSPRLLRRQSGAPGISLQRNQSSASNSAQRPVPRSKSTTKSRSNRVEGHLNGSMAAPTPSIQKRPQENRDRTFVKFLQRSQRSSTGHAAGRAKLTPPSAWALSPGRPPPISGRTKTANCGTGGMGGVLKYFRMKKVSPIQEGALHQFRLLHNRLLQWRFANARSESAMAAIKIYAEGNLFRVWARVIMLRNSIVEKLIQMQRFKHEMKLFHMLSPQICLLKDWATLESRNTEALGRLARKLSAISISLPLVQGAKAGTVSEVSDAMSTAMDVIDSVEASITNFLSQVERTCYLLTKLVVMDRQQKEYMEQLDQWITMVASLEEEERSLRIYLMQVAKQSRRVQSHKED